MWLIYRAMAAQKIQSFNVFLFGFAKAGYFLMVVD